MKIFSRKSTFREFTPIVPEFSFCERVTATPSSPIHIRKVGPEGQKFTGGAPDTALCAALLHKGWDLLSEVTGAKVEVTAKLEVGCPGRTCSDCADIFLVR